VTGGAGTGHLASVLDLDIVLQQGFTDGLPLISLDNRALRAEFMVR
jgi:hypothetical protein